MAFQKLNEVLQRSIAIVLYDLVLIPVFFVKENSWVTLNIDSLNLMCCPVDMSHPDVGVLLHSFSQVFVGLGQLFAMATPGSVSFHQNVLLALDNDPPEIRSRQLDQPQLNRNFLFIDSRNANILPVVPKGN